MPRCQLSMRGNAAIVCLALMLGGCFGNREVACGKPEEYQSSRSIDELEVPPGLDEPPQASLQIPEVANADEPPPDRPCLEQPPDYFGR